MNRALADSRADVAKCMRRLYERGLTTASGGNISLRTACGHILLTASKFDKAELEAEQVCVLATDGSNLTPELQPSIESAMHLEIYRRHAQVNAIVHAHPVAATAFCASGVPLNSRYIAESYAILGNPVYAEYACMGSRELADEVAAAAAGACCVLLRNHGVLTTGGNLAQAFDRMEVAEAAARTQLMLSILDGGREIAPRELEQLDCLMGR
jgi:L-fuculose-phosphate aldolase